MAINFDQLSDDQLKVAKIVADEAKLQGVDPNLILPLAYQESRFNAKALGPKTRFGKAIGVMQLLPSTAKEMGVDPYDLEQNIKGGIAYWKKQFDNPSIGNGKDADRAHIAYNAGPNSKYFQTNKEDDIPTESIKYLQGIRNWSSEPEQKAIEPSPESTTAPPESVTTGEEVLNDTSVPEEATVEVAGPLNEAAEEPKGVFDFDFEAFKKKQEAEKAAAPYGFHPEQVVPAASTGAVTGATVGGGYMGARAIQGLANAPQTIASAVQAANTATSPSGSPAAVRNWGATQGNKDRGAKNYKQSHQFEEGTRQASGRIDPRTGREIKPTFRFSKPPVFEAPAQPPPPSNLKKAGNLATKIMSSPIVKGTLGMAGVGGNTAEAYERYREDDYLGMGLSGLSALSSGASMIPGFQLPATAVSLASTGALAAADTIRNKLASEAQNPQPEPSDAELAELAKKPIGGFYPNLGMKRRSVDERKQIQQQLMQGLSNQMTDFSKPSPQPPFKK